MNDKQRPQGIRPMTDKPANEMMNGSTRHPSSIHMTNHSNDENSDSESIASSCSPFVAVPKEFRPHFPILMNSGHSKVATGIHVQIPLNESVYPAGKINTEKTWSNVPLLANPKSEFTECKKSLNQNETPICERNTKLPKNVEKFPQPANDIITTQNRTDKKNFPNQHGRTLLPLPEKRENSPTLRKQSTALDTRRQKKEKDKHKIKYEYVKKQTVKLNYDMPPVLKHVFEFDVKHMKPFDKQKRVVFKKPNEYIEKQASVEFSPQKSPILKKELEFQVQNVKPPEQHMRDVPKNVNKNSNTKVRINFDENAATFTHQEYTVRWDSSLNLDESISDNDDRIEWTIIKEEKTIVSGKKVENKDHTYKQLKNECVPTKPCQCKRPKKIGKRRNYNRNFNRNYRKNPPKHDQPDAKEMERRFHENDLQLNNNLKHDNTKIQNSDIQNERILDTETFTQLCRISEKERQNMDSSSSNDEPILMKNHSSERFYPEKVDNIILEQIEERKNIVLYYGKEMSDLIIGCHNALVMLILTFDDWKCLRLELISSFENLLKDLKESTARFRRLRDMLGIAQNGVSLATAIPVPQVSIAAKVISVLSSLFSIFLNSAEKKKAEVDDSIDISIAATKDTNASASLYMHTLQCGQQFEETVKVIEEFHSNVGDPTIFENDCPEMATFLRGVLEYRPTHRFFYKKLHKCFREMLLNCKSDFAKRFCEPFLSYPPTIMDIIEHLDWRFRHEDFNGESVRFELEQIQLLFGRNDAGIKELEMRIQNCIHFLKDEMKFLEGCMKGITFFKN